MAVLRRRCSSTSPEAAAVLIPVNSSEGLPTLTAGQQEVKSAMMADARPFKLLFAGPGYGKTVVMMSIIIDFYNRGFWVRCLVPLSQVCGDIRRKLEASGMPALAAAETVMTVQRFTTPGFVDSSMQPGGNIERAVRRLVMFDEALSLDGDLLDNVYYKMGGDVRLAQFMMFGDCFQMPSVGIPAAHSVMLQPTAEFRLFSFPSGGSMRTSHPIITAIVTSLRSVHGKPLIADRLLTEWHFAGIKSEVDVWVVSTHRQVESRNRARQNAATVPTFTATTVQLTGRDRAAQDVHPVRLWIGCAVMTTCNFTAAASSDEAAAVGRISNRTMGRVLGWSHGFDVDETIVTDCGSDVTVTVQFYDTAGKPRGEPVLISPIVTADKTCRRLPIQALGGMTVDCSQGMTLPAWMTIGVDGTGACDPRSFWTVAISRKQVARDADLYAARGSDPAARDGCGIGAIVYDGDGSGSVLVEAERTQMDIALRELCAAAESVDIL